MVAYFGDFGLARFLHRATVISFIGYVPPGLMTFVSPEGDVYNYGILLLEMQTRKGPTDIMFGDGLSLCELGKKGISDKITAQLLMP
ncbi:LRR receptor-like kinase family protein, putative [Medicago truncatula]|uniref:LRR receptor-like kinase family protein, putative n=1 Tax=Medicago truncatula TaxID=3880 RepID=G7KGY6_MEDTR|nr:LRR receptor-like kinase family protein, putative [Medicago truncatula]